MLTLCGFAASNYYNKVKLALLEKGIPFQERLVYPSKEAVLLEVSPMGKLPYIETDAGPLAESQVIIEYLEATWPEPPLYPADAFERARCRELIALLELHMELVARRLYPQAFFGGKVSEETQEQVRRDLPRGVKAFLGRAKFAPYVAGESFTYADCAAAMHLPVISQASQAVLGSDLLADAAPIKPYLQRMRDRPHVKRVNADRKANLEQMLAVYAKK